MKKILTLLVLLLCSAGVFAQSATQDDDAKYAVDLIKPGTVAPQLKLKTPEGKTLQTKFMRGHYTVLDFWASWCPDCRKDIPNMQRIYEEFHPLGVEFVGISMDTNVDAWKNALTKYGIVYPQGSELRKFHDTDVAKAFGVKWIPSMVLVDPDGKVVLGTVLSDKLEKTLTEIFADKQPKVDSSLGR